MFMARMEWWGESPKQKAKREPETGDSFACLFAWA